MIYKREEILPFWSEKGPNGIYSQWYMRDIEINGVRFCCNEQYMMYSKAMLFNDLEMAKSIMNTNDPKQIKAFGRLVKNFDSKVWGENKERIVYEANLAKFSQHDDLKQELLNTKNKVIIEASPRDCIWGVGRYANSSAILDTNQWRGLNLLGIAIMKVRDEINQLLQQ